MSAEEKVDHGAPIRSTEKDEAELARMGYKQELKRDLGLMQNFGVSFSIISVITGIPSLFLYGLVTGGPAVMVGLGGCRMLSRKKNAALASWITGWFNLLGQVAVTTGISFGCANSSRRVYLGTSLNPRQQLPSNIYAAVLFTQGLTNTFGVEILHQLNNILCGGTQSVPRPWSLPSWRKLLSAKCELCVQTVFGRNWADGVGWGERSSHAYVAVIGILMAQYTLTDLPTTLDSPTGQPVAQIFLDTVGEKGAIVLMVIVIGAMYFCGTFSITSNSRMMYAFARDGGIPGHKFLAKLYLGICRVLEAASPLLRLHLSHYRIVHLLRYPIALRVVYRDAFVRGPFHLGRFSYPVAISAVLWIAFISIAFVLPQVNPVNSQTLNYSIVAVGVVVVYSVGFWLLSARKWFTGPVRQIEAEELGIDVLDLRRRTSTRAPPSLQYQDRNR
ncbi:amino acid transporter [Ephemerocybe angulata]|uniref:Amino acid transporter n=1 Tax=Ephemerocybe angulata TaxID=980116 RepID=A0A8H6LYW0_9AGAR|nr:amino acid transporter [Tulosesus angulatus]